MSIRTRSIIGRFAFFVSLVITLAFTFGCGDNVVLADPSVNDTPNGNDGKNGINGSNGRDGRDGVDGTSCEVVVPMDGVNDYEILCGGVFVGYLNNGADGTDGISCEVAVSTSVANDYEISCGGVFVGYLNNGAPGPQGPVGPIGPPGPQGPAGANGAKGGGCTVGEDGAWLVMTCEDNTEERWAKAWCGAQAYDPEVFVCRRGQLTYTDTRVGGNNMTYRIVAMPDGKYWMAENLNYRNPLWDKNDVTGTVDYTDKGSWYYDNDSTNYAKYGRLYTWAAAMEACPESDGWYLPTDAEWTVLETAVGGSSTAGTKLKSPDYWQPYSGVPTGTDEYGFSALPGGYRWGGGDFNDAGNYGYWWSTTEDVASYAWGRGMHDGSENVLRGAGNKGSGFSVRCVRRD